MLDCLILIWELMRYLNTLKRLLFQIWNFGRLIRNRKVCMFFMPLLPDTWLWVKSAVNYLFDISKSGKLSVLSFQICAMKTLKKINSLCALKTLKVESEWTGVSVEHTSSFCMEICQSKGKKGNTSSSSHHHSYSDHLSNSLSPSFIPVPSHSSQPDL